MNRMALIISATGLTAVAAACGLTCPDLPREAYALIGAYVGIALLLALDDWIL